MLKHVDGWVSALVVPEVAQFCRDRGLTDAEIKLYQLGTHTMEDSLHYNRLMFPLRQFGLGDLVGYQSRTVPEIEPPRQRPLPKYYHDVHDKSKHWFGIDRIVNAKNSLRKVVVVSEGPFDPFPIHRLGFDAGAYMGSSVSDHQAAIIAAITPSVILLADGDAAGEKNIGPNAEKFYRMGLKTYVNLCPHGQDPDSMDSDTLLKTIREAYRYEDSEWFVE